LELLRPFSDSVTLSILVTRATVDRWIEVAKLRLSMRRARIGYFPPTFPSLSTRLFDLNLPLKAGRAELKYMFPIRGVSLRRRRFRAWGDDGDAEALNSRFERGESGVPINVSWFFYLQSAGLLEEFFRLWGPRPPNWSCYWQVPRQFISPHAQPGASQPADAILEIKAGNGWQVDSCNWRLPE
jgi:hypothetical protein